MSEFESSLALPALSKNVVSDQRVLTALGVVLIALLKSVVSSRCDERS